MVDALATPNYAYLTVSDASSLIIDDGYDDEFNPRDECDVEIDVSTGRVDDMGEKSGSNVISGKRIAAIAISLLVSRARATAPPHSLETTRRASDAT